MSHCLWNLQLWKVTLCNNSLRELRQQLQILAAVQEGLHDAGDAWEEVDPWLPQHSAGEKSS